MVRWMKNNNIPKIGLVSIAVAFTLFTGTHLFGQSPVTHFQPVANTGITRPVQIDTAWISVNGVARTLNIGDEVGVFDGDLCVGAVKIELLPHYGLPNNRFPLTFASILAAYTPNDTLPGAVEGNPMTFKIWDHETDTEIYADPTFERGGLHGDLENYVDPLQTQTTMVKLETVPEGLTYYVDGLAYTRTDTLLMKVGRTYSLQVDSIQAAGETGKRYRINNWAGVDFDSTYNFTIPVSGTMLTVTATFDTEYELTINTDHGTPTGQGWYVEGATANFSVDPDTVTETDTRYIFTQWTGAGTGSYTGTTRSTSVTMNNPITETAEWRTQHLLTLSTPYGTTTGGGWYDEGVAAPFRVDARIIPGTTGTRYAFVSWTGTGNGAVSGTDSSMTATMNGPITEVASWQTEYELTLVTAQGTATGAGWYAAGSQATFYVDSTGVADGVGSRWFFDGWTGTGNNSQTGPDSLYTVLMNNPITETAAWRKQYLLSVVSPNGGVNGHGWYYEGSTAPFSVQDDTLDDGAGTRYIFTGWTGVGTGSYTGTDPSQSVIMNNPITETASWNTEYQLTVSSLWATTVGNGWYPSGTNATFSISSLNVSGGVGKRYIFQGWTGTGAASATVPDSAYTIAMTSPVTETANWQTEYLVTLTSEYGTTSGGGWYTNGTDVDISVGPRIVNMGQGIRYLFTGWTGTGNGSYTGVDSARTITIDNTAITEVASWSRQYYLDIVSDHGTLSGEGWYDEGGSATFSLANATVTYGDTTRYQFLQWIGTGVGSYTGDQLTQTVTMNNAITETISWRTEYKLDVTSLISTTSGTGWYVDGTDATFGITPTEVSLGDGQRHFFTQWNGTGTGSYDGTDSTYTVTMSNPITQEAIWHTQYFLTTSVNPDTGGTVNPAVPGAWYNSGDVVQISAVPAAQHQWAGWTGAVNPLNAMDNPASITMDAPKAVTGNFGKEVNVTINTVPTGLKFIADGVEYTAPQTFSWVQFSQHQISVASPQAGLEGIQYVYTSWSDGGGQTHFYSVPSAGGSVTANFQTQYKLTVTSERGVAHGDGWYNAGSNAEFYVESRTVPIVTGSRYYLTGWTGTGGGSYTGEEISQIVTMNNPITETAEWVTQYELSVGSDVPEAEITGPGWYNAGSNATITLVSENIEIGTGARHNFAGWKYAANYPYGAMDNPATVVMNSAVNDTATWNSQYYLAMAVNPDGAGTVTPNPPGQWYDSGTEVTVSATEGVGFTWGGWSGDLSTTDTPTTIVVDEPKSLTANFGVIVTVTITTNPAGRQFIADGVTYTTAETFQWVENSHHTLSVVSPQSVGTGIQSAFDSWSNGGDQTHDYQVPIGGGTLEVDFKTQYLLTLNTSQGTATGGGWYDAGAAATFRLNSRTVPIADGSRYLFTGWSGTGNGSYTGTDSSRTVTMNNAITETAGWKIQHRLSVISTIGNVAGNGWYDEGATATFSVPLESIEIGTGIRHFFDGWEGVGFGAYSGTDNPRAVQMLNPITETAIWETQYYLTTTVSPADAGTVVPASPGDWYESGSTVEISAVANPGNQFARWSGDYTGTLNPASLQMDEPKSVTALFGDETQVVIRTIPPGLEYTVDGVLHNAMQTFYWIQGTEHTVSVVATQSPTTGTKNTFQSWSDNGEISHTYTAPTTTDTLTALYQRQHYLTLSTAYGTTTGQGWYNEGVNATFALLTPTVLSETGTKYEFEEWQGTGQGAYTGTDTSRTVVMNNPITETAQWDTYYHLTVTADPDTGGIITITPNKEWFQPNESVSVSVVDNPAFDDIFDFIGWTGDIQSTNPNIWLTMNQSYEMEAEFNVNDRFPPYTFDVYPANEAGGVAVNNWVELKVRDDIHGVKLTTLNVTVAGRPVIRNGVDQTGGEASVNGIDRGYYILYNPSNDFAESTNIAVSVSCQDLANPVNSLNYSYQFTTGDTRITYTTIRRVTSAGIDLDDGSGVRISIPPGALGETVSISIGTAENQPAFPDTMKGVGQVYYIGPDGYTFNSPASIRLPYSTSELEAAGVLLPEQLTVLWYSTSTGRWQEIEGTLDAANNRVTFQTNGLGYFSLAAWTEDLTKMAFDGFAKIYNYPNPFNPSENPTIIRYQISKSGKITLRIYDVSGSIVTTLVDREDRIQLLPYQEMWDGKNGRGEFVANNIYFCVIQSSSGERVVRKIAVLR